MPRLSLSMIGNILVARTSDREAGLAPKAAGFRWHGRDCRGCKACIARVPSFVWWTDDPARAARLLDAADAVAPEAKAFCDSAHATMIASRATSADVDVPSPPGLSYLPFQRAGIAYVLNALKAGKRGVLIADEMGLGKTVQAIGVLNAKLGKMADEEIEKFRVLVVCPASLRQNWKRELERWLVRPLRVEILDKSLPAEAQVVVSNFERVRRPEVKDALSVPWDVLIVDEAHRLKDPKSQQTKAVLGCTKTKKREAVVGLESFAKTLLFLTGTPILARPVEAQPLLQTLDPSFAGFGFLKRYCDAHREYVGRTLVWNFSGASHLDELQARLRASIMVRRLKSEVLKELPPKRREIVVLDSDEVKKLVADENRGIAKYEDTIAEVETEARLALADGNLDAYHAAAAKLEKISSVAFTEIASCRKALAIAKVPLVLEHCDVALEADGKILVFTHHHEVTDAIAQHYAGRCIVIDGRTPMTDRQALVDGFQTDATIRVAVLSIAAAGVGLTLTAAQHVVFAELDWTPANVTQAEDRAHRIGQMGSVLVQHLVFNGSLDARMVELLIQKQNVFDRMLDASTEVKLTEMSNKTKAQHERRNSRPALPAAQVAAAHLAMRILAGFCDGARRKDGAGFNKIDARVGHSLAKRDQLTNEQAYLAKSLAKIYRRQLPADLLTTLFG